MTRPISARTRADAIAICEQRHDEANDLHLTIDLVSHLNVRRASPDAWSLCRAYELAICANHAVMFVRVFADAWLEASGILRDGWCPGDPVEVRK